jgi:hypothetical protein
VAITRVLPQAKPTPERIGVVARSATRRQPLQLSDVASPQHHVIGLEGGGQAGDDVRDIEPPLLFASLL